jgi:hypothetical protein
VSGDRRAAAPRAPGACAQCGSALACDQRYCLSCGARRGPRPLALVRILDGLRQDEGRTSLPLAPAARQRSGVWRRGRVVGLPYPTAAVLTLAMLAFGTLTGAAASNPSGALSTLRGPLKLLIPAHTPSAAALAAVPPVAEGAPTPEATPPPPPAESAPASEPAPSPGAHHKHSHGSSGSSAGGGGTHLPPIKHVFLIVLADQPYAQTFSPESPAPYLAHTLEQRGELLERFYAVAHEELADEIALISGLGPTPQTAADCPVFDDILPAIPNSHGQYGGQGCIYPKAAQTIGDQLTAKGLTWRVYAEGMGENGGAGGAKSCGHPEFGAADPTYQAPQGDTFATFRDPFTYFDGVLHSPACAREDTGIEGLAGELKSARSTPTLSYIVPDLCHDGRPTPCAPGAPSGLPAAEAFLRRVVPEILASPGYRRGGLLIVTTDQAPATGEYAESSSCCMQPRLAAPLAVTPGATPTGAAPVGGSPESDSAQPTTSSPGSTTSQQGATATQPDSSVTPTTTATANPTTAPAATTPTTATPTTSTLTPTSTSTTAPATSPAATTPSTNPTVSPGVHLPPSGGGQVGALLISPYVKPGTFNQEPFNDFSLLRTLENLFGLPPLGYAATRGLSSLEASVFSAWNGAAAASAAAARSS